MNKPLDQAASHEPNLYAVVEVVKGYHLLCSQVVRRSGSCNSQAERRNERSQINAMVQACIHLHIAMMPAAPSVPAACDPVARIVLPDID